MPVQRTICGTPVLLRMPPRRFQVLSAVIFSLVVTLLLFGAPSRDKLPTYEEVKDAVKNPQLPSMENLPELPELPELPSLKDLPTVPNPFGPSAHKPPVQPNSNSSSSYGSIQWMFDFKWRNPFSSKISLDENTAVLPPLKKRPTIYTFYDPEEKQAKEVVEAENRLVLAWRRAWWAQGFRPQVLSRAEAMKHPHYGFVRRLKLEEVDPSIEAEIMRWLAWGYMDGGILTNWLALPMAEYDNPILSFLRKEEYPVLSRIDGLSNGVFFGDKAVVNAAIRQGLESRLFRNVTAHHSRIVNLKKNAGVMVNLLDKSDCKVEPQSHGIAYYSTSTIKTIYKSLADKLTNRTHLEGLDLLGDLINSHLHLTFQNTFSEGVAVVKPLPEHTTALMYEAIDIARNLTQCPTSPIPKSCPPNQSRCKPCNPAKLKSLQLLPSMKNSSSLYTIGTVPHPYTLNSLHYTRDSLDANFLRQHTERDLWVDAATQELRGDQSTEKGVVLFKETVASPKSPPNSLWLTAERVSQADIEWIFGFNLPNMASPNEDPSSPDEKSELIIFPRPGEPEPIEGVVVPEDKWIMKEEVRLGKARDAIKSKDKLWKGVINAAEKWNLADTEVWRFSRAFSARRRQERKQWEEEEKKFAGSEKKSGVKSQGEGKMRWSDRFL